MRPILLGLLLLAFAAGCELLPEADTPRRLPDGDATQFEGFFAQGFEDSTFQPCGSDESWWATGEADAMRTLAEGYLDAGERIGYAPVFARVQATLSPPGSYGNFDKFERALTIEEVLEVRPARPDDCD